MINLKKLFYKII